MQYINMLVHQLRIKNSIIVHNRDTRHLLEIAKHAFQLIFISFVKYIWNGKKPKKSYRKKF